jgi:hypothetical protein
MVDFPSPSAERLMVSPSPAGGWMVDFPSPSAERLMVSPSPAGGG